MDEEDYKHALSGSNDLAGCVLKGADFKGMSLRNRDFSGAKLEGSNFEGSDLEGSSFLGASINHVNFSNSNLRKSQFNGGNVMVNFNGANLSSARLSGVYLSTDFRSSNLSEANLSGAHLNEGCQFDDAIVSEQTLFDGTHVLRPYSRLPPFRYYTFERGVLQRIPESVFHSDKDRLRLDAIDAITNGIQELSRIPVRPEGQHDAIGIGHNGPPEEFQLGAADVHTAKAQFSEAKDALEAHEKHSEKYRRAIETAKTLARQAAVWSGQIIGSTVSEFAKEFGKTLGGKTALAVVALHFTGALERIVHTLTRFIESMM